jgi:hypothetical protein
MANPSKKGAKSEVEVAAEAKRKKEILDKVAQSNLPTKTILKELGISRSTYYSWLKRYEEEGDEGLLDSRSLPRAEEEVKERVPAVEEIEPQVTEVEPVEEVVEETPPEPFAETVTEVKPPSPASEEPVVAFEEPVATPVKEEPQKREEVVIPKETTSFGGGEKRKGLGIYTFIAILLLILGLLFSVSLSNYNTYQLRQTDNTITLWKGKFSARGFKLVESFEPLAVGDSDVSALINKNFTGEDAVLKAIYAFLMDQISAEVAKGSEADNGKINLLLAKAEDIVGADAKGDRSMAKIRYQLAEKRVTIAEMELKKAYEKALPVYEEASRVGLGDIGMLGTKIAAMQEFLGLLTEETVEAAPEEAEPEVAPEAAGAEAESAVAPPEAPAQEAEPEVAPETTGEEELTATPPEAEVKEAEPEVAPETAGEEELTATPPEAEVKEAEPEVAPEAAGAEAESAAAPEATAEVAETATGETEGETPSEAVEQEEKPNEPTSFMDWLKSRK